MTTPENPDDLEARLARRRASTEGMERLIRANTESNETMHTLIERVRQDAQMRERKIDLLEDGLHRTRQLLLLVGVALVLLLGIAGVNAIAIQQGRKNLAATAEVAQQAKDTYALLYGCIDATGECGRQNAAKTKEALDKIKQYEVIVIFCARSNPRDGDEDGTKFLACVERLYPGGPTLPVPAASGK